MAGNLNETADTIREIESFEERLAFTANLASASKSAAERSVEYEKEEADREREERAHRTRPAQLEIGRSTSKQVRPAPSSPSHTDGGGGGGGGGEGYRTSKPLHYDRDRAVMSPKNAGQDGRRARSTMATIQRDEEEEAKLRLIKAREEALTMTGQLDHSTPTQTSYTSPMFPIRTPHGRFSPLRASDALHSLSDINYGTTSADIHWKRHLRTTITHFRPNSHSHNHENGGEAGQERGGASPAYPLSSPLVRNSKKRTTAFTTDKATANGLSKVGTPTLFDTMGRTYDGRTVEYHPHWRGGREDEESYGSGGGGGGGGGGRRRPASVNSMHTTQRWEEAATHTHPIKYEKRGCLASFKDIDPRSGKPTAYSQQEPFIYVASSQTAQEVSDDIAGNPLHAAMHSARFKLEATGKVSAPLSGYHKSIIESRLLEEMKEKERKEEEKRREHLRQREERLAVFRDKKRSTFVESLRRGEYYAMKKWHEYHAIKNDEIEHHQKRSYLLDEFDAMARHDSDLEETLAGAHEVELKREKEVEKRRKSRQSEMVVASAKVKTASNNNVRKKQMAVEDEIARVMSLDHWEREKAPLVEPPSLHE